MTSPKDVSLSAINRGGEASPLWLGSASPRRADLLAQIGIVPQKIIAADIDETPLKQELPRLYVQRLAQAKAEELCKHEKLEDVYLLTADTVVAVGRRILQKTADEAEARAHLSLLSGRAHRVWTAICLAYRGQTYMRLCETRVKFKLLHSREIDDYIATQEWIGKAGAYAIQGQAAKYITNIAGSYSNIVGLPLYETTQLLHAHGYW